MKKIIGLLGIVVLLATIAVPALAQGRGIGYHAHISGDYPGLASENLTKVKHTRLAMLHRKINNGTLQPFRTYARERAEKRIEPQNIGPEIIVGDRPLEERISKPMDNVFAASFAHAMAQFRLEREGNNAELTALRLLEARIGLESICHAMEDPDADAVYRELEKPSEEVDVDLILNAVSEAYPTVRDHYNKNLTA